MTKEISDCTRLVSTVELKILSPQDIVQQWEKIVEYMFVQRRLDGKQPTEHDLLLVKHNLLNRKAFLITFNSDEGVEGLVVASPGLTFDDDGALVLSCLCANLKVFTEEAQKSIVAQLKEFAKSQHKNALIALTCNDGLITLLRKTGFVGYNMSLEILEV